MRDVAQVQKMVRSWRSTKVDFVHVPREENVLADWAFSVALELQQDIDVVSLAPDLHEGMAAPVDCAA